MPTSPAPILTQPASGGNEEAASLGNCPIYWYNWFILEKPWGKKWAKAAPQNIAA